MNKEVNKDEKEQYKALFELDKMLEETNIPHKLEHTDSAWYLFYTTIDDEECQVSNYILFGEDQGTLAIDNALLTCPERIINGVVYNLTAQQVFERIYVDYIVKNAPEKLKDLTGEAAEFYDMVYLHPIDEEEFLAYIEESNAELNKDDYDND